MVNLRRSKKDDQPVEKVLDINATMQGTMVFKDPVDLRINGEFEGKLDTRGNLTIGENARIMADINGENITIAGKVTGNIIATGRLNLIAPANIIGDIVTPALTVSEGAILNGNCKMSSLPEQTVTSGRPKAMALDEVARYLEVDTSLVKEWATQKKIPATKENNTWKFHKEEVDSWIAKEKVSK
jgi:excisionase family DNA binding protein